MITTYGVVRVIGRRREQVILHVIAISLIAVYSSFNRPIWIDEFLQFAFAAFSLSEAVETILLTNGDSVNHGQTGFYSFLNVVFLHAFGANLIALRFPSLLATYLLFVSAWLFMGNLGFGFRWKLVATFVLAANSKGMTGLMYFAGEARPYMLLASTTVATLAYYTAPIEKRRSIGWILVGAYGVVIGFLNHPYFLGYWLTCVFFGFLYRYARKTMKISPRGFLAHLNPVISSLGLSLYVLLGSLGWLRGSPAFDLDPWEWISFSDAVRILYRTHIAAWASDLPSFITLLFPLILILVGLLTAIYGRGKTRVAITLAFTLVGLAVLTTVAISALSFFRDYWVLPRQWVAGMAVASLGMVWLMAEIFRYWINRRRFSTLAAGAILSVTLGLSLTLPIAREVTFTIENQAYWIELSRDSALIEDLIEAGEWERAANLNIHQGGPVDHRLSLFYRRD